VSLALPFNSTLSCSVFDAGFTRNHRKSRNSNPFVVTLFMGNRQGVAAGGTRGRFPFANRVRGMHPACHGRNTGGFLPGGAEKGRGPAGKGRGFARPELVMGAGNPLQCRDHSAGFARKSGKRSVSPHSGRIFRKAP